MSKRNRDRYRGNVQLDLHQQSVDLRYSNGWLHRVVDEESAEELQRATRGIRGNNLTRVAGFFSLTYIYPHLLSRARESSRLSKPPTTDTIAQELGRLPIESLHQAVEAEVIDVKPFHNAVGICVTFPELQAENAALIHRANQLIQPTRSLRFTPGTSGHHVSVIKGIVTCGQLSQIKRLAPPSITLSAIKAGCFYGQTIT